MVRNKRKLGNRALAGVSLLAIGMAWARAPAHAQQAAPGAKELITIAKVWELAQLERWTGAEYRADTVFHRGTSAGFVDLLELVHGVDGVVLRPLALVSTVHQLVDDVLPVLRPTVEPAAGTLRDRLGLVRPANRFVTAH